MHVHFINEILKDCLPNSPSIYQRINQSISVSPTFRNPKLIHRLVNLLQKLNKHLTHNFIHSDRMQFTHTKLCQNRNFHSSNEMVHTNQSQNLCSDLLRHDTFLVGPSFVSYRPYRPLYLCIPLPTLSVFYLSACSLLFFVGLHTHTHTHTNIILKPILVQIQ